MRSIAILAGKGGVTKSTIARAISTRCAKRGKSVAAFDLDDEQATFRRWMQRRKNAGITPLYPVVGDISPLTLGKKLKESKHDYVIIDGAAYASKITLEIARLVDLVVIPTSYTIDDIESTVRVALGLLKKGIPASRVVVVFSGVLESATDHKETLEYVRSQGINAIDGYIPLQKGYAKTQDRGFAISEVKYPRLFTLARMVLDEILQRAEDN